MPEAKKILIVDDDADIRELLTHVMTAEGYAVECAINGKEGLQKIKEWLPDLVLLDIMMPLLDGYHVAKEIKQDNSFKQKPKVVFITSRDTIKESKLMEYSGADGALAKPFDLNEVKNLVAQTLK